MSLVVSETVLGINILALPITRSVLLQRRSSSLALVSKEASTPVVCNAGLPGRLPERLPRLHSLWGGGGTAAHVETVLNSADKANHPHRDLDVRSFMQGVHRGLH